MINTSYNSYLYPQAGQRVPGSNAFSVPKSPLRTESTDPYQSLIKDRNITDSVELSSTRPDLLGLPQANPLPIEAEPLPSLGFGKPAGTLDNDRRRAAGQEDEEALGETDAAEEDEEQAKPGDATDTKGQPLDDQQQQEVSELENRDREVRAHEQAHKSVGGSYAGAISYDYQQGPDGKRYAVGGEVSIDVSEEKEPSATAAKMRQVRAAALAPAEPSSQDLQVAAEASRIETEARQEMSQERMAKAQGGESGETAKSGETEETEGASGSAARNDVAAPAQSGAGSSASPYAKLSDPYSRFGSAALAAFGYTGIDVMA